jgi:hypothetical protein
MKLCGKCRMYRMRATEHYRESDWCGLWLQEEWITIENDTVKERTDETFMCPLHRINYHTLYTLGEVNRDIKPLPATHVEAIRLPSDGTGGLAVELHYYLNLSARAFHQKGKESGFGAGVKRRRSL